MPSPDGPTRFKRLVVKNNWEYLTYHWKHDGTAALDERRPGRALVRWPDGSRGWVDFFAKEKTAAYTDHGHSANVDYYIPSVTTQIHGLNVEVKLFDLLVAEIRQ